MSQSYLLKQSIFFNFASFMLEALGQFPLVSLTSQGTLWAGVIGVGLSCLLGFFALKDNKPMMKLFLCLVVCIAAAEIAVGAVIQSQLDLINKTIYGGATYSAVPAAENSLTGNTIHFQLSMFNLCCATQTWTREKFPGSSDNTRDLVPTDYDLDGFVKPCSKLTAPNLAKIQTSGSFRSCYYYTETYRKYNFTTTVNADYICSTMRKATVDITDKYIPGSSVLKIQSYTNNHVILPLVGFNDDPTFGCGAGYAKAFQAAQFLWIEQNLKPGATTLLVCGVLSIVVIIFALATSCSGNGSRETAEQAYERYMAEVQANGGVPSRPATQRFDQANPGVVAAASGYDNRMSYNSAYSKASGPTAAYMQDVPVANVANTFNVDDKI